LLKEFDADNLQNLYLNKLSSGQKKKIMVIQSLLHDPEILIMDEPTENMDPDTREIFYKLIKQLNMNGKTIFISTHQLDEIKNFANYVVVIKNGNIKYCDSFNQNTNLNELYKKV
jgi:ABC-2 type transport system ATP-binding protein